MSTPLLENILNQPRTLRAVVEYQLGEGYRAVQQAADLLCGKKRILLSGMGASHFACTPFYYSLAARGHSVTLVEASELLHFLPLQADENTVAVLVSRSGESVEAVHLISKLKESGAVVLGIVNVPGSNLAVNADQTVLMNSPADQLVAIQTYVATLTVFALLETTIFGELQQAKNEVEITIDLLTRFVPEYLVASKAWTGFLTGNQPLYLLGRGPSLGTVAEGVLLMHEIAKSPAVGMSAAQFRHGPVEVIDQTFRGIVIGTQPATAVLDAALATELSGMGAQIRWIGPDVVEAALTPLAPWPATIPRRFVAILETILLQLAAYRKAELLGYTPGAFRWAPAITTSETGFSTR